jgi:hypothetical protein
LQKIKFVGVAAFEEKRFKEKILPMLMRDHGIRKEK